MLLKANWVYYSHCLHDRCSEVGSYNSNTTSSAHTVYKNKHTYTQMHYDIYDHFRMNVNWT